MPWARSPLERPPAQCVAVAASAAVKAADLPPHDNGLFTAAQRHQRSRARGLDLLTVAQILGTSVVMIERHYGHLRGEVAATALARLAL